MNQPSFIFRTLAGWPLAIVSIALTLQPAIAAPPIEMVFEDCAADELPPANHAATPQAIGDAGCAVPVHRAGYSGHCGGRDVCCATIEEVTEEKSCWNVKCEKVCVPAIRFPWEPGGSPLKFLSSLCRSSKNTACGETVCGDACTDCAVNPAGHCYPARCGAVRCVSILEADSYEVTTCQCKWEIRRLPSCCDGASCGGAIEVSPYETEVPADPAADAVLPAPRR